MLQLKKFPDVPVSTREEARESRPHPEEPRFRLIAREEGSFPAWSGKNSRRSRRISRGGALHRKGERNSRVVPPFPESSRCLNPFQGNLFSLHCLDFQAEDRLTPRWHVGQPCGKAWWESLVGKSRGKASRESRRSLDPREGNVTLLLQLGRKAHVHAPLETRTDSPRETSEVPQDPCQHWREILRFRNRLHTRPWPRHRRERNPERSRTTCMGTGLS